VSFQTVLSPMIAVLLGWLLLREPVGPAFAGGAALVLLGTWIAVRTPAAPRKG
jgi:drug/metabolite transporter (DMT)-like permease